MSKSASLRLSRAEIESGVISKRNARKRNVPGWKLARLGVRVVRADDCDVDAAVAHFAI
jgi:hypothetical protein